MLDLPPDALLELRAACAILLYDESREEQQAAVNEMYEILVKPRHGVTLSSRPHGSPRPFSARSNVASSCTPPCANALSTTTTILAPTPWASQ